MLHSPLILFNNTILGSNAGSFTHVAKHSCKYPRGSNSSSGDSDSEGPEEENMEDGTEDEQLGKDLGGSTRFKK